MTRTVVVGVDGSPQADRALDHALETFPDAEVLVLTVVDPGSLDLHFQVDVVGFDRDWWENARAHGEKTVAAARERAEARGRTVETAVEFGDPARTIVEFAESKDADHVVVGSHGRSLPARVLLGSVAGSVVRRSAAPVTVVR